MKYECQMFRNKVLKLHFNKAEVIKIESINFNVNNILEIKIGWISSHNYLSNIKD